MLPASCWESREASYRSSSSRIYIYMLICYYQCDFLHDEQEEEASSSSSSFLSSQPAIERARRDGSHTHTHTLSLSLSLSLFPSLSLSLTRSALNPNPNFCPKIERLPVQKNVGGGDGGVGNYGARFNSITLIKFLFYW